MATARGDGRTGGRHAAGPAALVLTATVARRYHLDVQLTGALSPPHDGSPVELVRDVARRSTGQGYYYYYYYYYSTRR